MSPEAERLLKVLDEPQAFSSAVKSFIVEVLEEKKEGKNNGKSST